MRKDKKCQCDCRSGESCPTCAGLVCLERPRYFGGQLLTESDLNSYTVGLTLRFGKY